ncbi:TonB family protein [Hymenobacter busanensis]|uniref:TonB family protein n=1 Tax=Hymenobacter busanensis TaxID=2607656 RepID=A0A7L5A340_9BACT|nr:energy transducer TonB [Hymenobacter busanensis]KAA9333085.1 TonB family protein [Hymenobacter busanensis]QHJ08240.1 TonB family protein [Hymenobacter busanensis]
MRPANLRLPPDPPAPHLPAAVLRQYAADTLTPAERRRVEAHALDCDLCSDALDGYLTAPADATAPVALQELHQRLHTRIAADEREPRRAVAWWSAAAAAVLVLLVAAAALRWWLPAEVPHTSATAPVAASAPAPQAAEPTAPPAATESAPAADAPDVAAAAPAAPVTPPAETTRPAKQQPAYAAVGKPRYRRPAARVQPSAPVAGGTVAEMTDVVASSAPLASDSGTAEAEGVADAAGAAEKKETREEVAPLAKAKHAAAAPLPARRATALAADSAPTAPKAAPTLPGAAPTKGVLPAPLDVVPLPKGGYPAFRRYLSRNLKYTDDARTDRAEGDVKVRFVVDADGVVQYLQVVKSVHPDLDEEALRLVCEGPGWYPGVVNGKRAPRTVEISVPFRMPLR